ncbi:hypothetical protein V6N11_002028 [Hibiscus sabdariffa]|uniref:Clp ATPase C-terminal domain-containing protein n=1 Tax=Hibiscus sabdariffa TaxID=183260 RepID=A0ABR2QUT7_9ROSI
MEAARAVFRPEFMNCVDEHSVPAFGPRTNKQYREIKGKFRSSLYPLEHVQTRIADKKIRLRVTDSAVQLLGNLGYDPNYGARTVKSD